MDDWRYEGLRRDIDRLEKELRKAEDRTFEVKLWQQLFPLRVTQAIIWLIAAGYFIHLIALALTRSS
jgi:hypothetical protein